MAKNEAVVATEALAAADSEANAVEVASVGRQGNGPTSASDSKPGLSGTVLESRTF